MTPSVRVLTFLANVFRQVPPPQWRSQRAERVHANNKPSAEGARQLGGLGAYSRRKFLDFESSYTPFPAFFRAVLRIKWRHKSVALVLIFCRTARVNELKW